MSKLFRALCLLTLASPLAADTGPEYAALRAARPQSKGFAVKGLTLQRDAFRFRFESGAFQFLAPVSGRVIGAVFVGDGSWELTPALEAERRHLALVSGEKDLRTLSDRFESALFLFTDDTAAQIERQATTTDPPPGASEAFDRHAAHQRQKLKINLHLRILQDLLDGSPPASGVFLADVRGKRLPPALLLVDGFGLDWFAPTMQVGSESTGLFVTAEPDDGFWYLAPRQTQAANPAPGRARAHAERYDIETTIQKNTGLRGVTTIRFQALTPSLRLLPLLLLPRLRVRKVEFARAEGGWSEIPFVQEKAEEDADVAVVLPSPLAAKETARLRIAYEGDDVLRDVGDGNYVVTARTSWYPNLGTFSDLATYELTFRVPKANDVVSVGKPGESRIEGDTRVSTWKAEQPIRVAGFNYGKFKKIERPDRDSGLKVEVFTNPGTPDVIRDINDYLRRGRESSSRTVSGLSTPLPSDLDNPIGSVTSSKVGMQSVQIDTAGLAESAMVDGLNTARVATLYFGPLPYGRVAITQQAQWAFGQSWPSLIFLPFMAVFDSTTRREIGLKGSNDFVDSVGPHEFAHQWWGHLVGWDSYRDQWLSEGMADFTAALVLQYAKGWPQYAEHWEKQRRFILSKPRDGALTNDAAGPITQGLRLTTSRSPYAYPAMVYAKASFVIHMLRMAMRDPAAKKPDAAFMDMLKDFAASWAGKNPSTRDFQKVAERHMVPNLNATADGKLDWFFRQWVYGMEIPRYRVQLDLKSGQGDQYRLTGSIAQEGVSKDFAAVVPVYIEFAKGKLARFGLIPLVGNQSVPIDVVVKLPEKPKRALINAYHEVLSRD